MVIEHPDGGTEVVNPGTAGYVIGDVGVAGTGRAETKQAASVLGDPFIARGYRRIRRENDIQPILTFLEGRLGVWFWTSVSSKPPALPADPPYGRALPESIRRPVWWVALSRELLRMESAGGDRGMRSVFTGSGQAGGTGQSVD